MLHRFEGRNHDCNNTMKQILVDRSIAENERRSHYEPVFADLDAVKRRVRQVGERIQSSDHSDLQERKRIQSDIDALVGDIRSMKTAGALDYDVLRSQYQQTEQSVSALIHKHQLLSDDDRPLSCPPTERTPIAAAPREPVPAAVSTAAAAERIDADAERNSAILAQIKDVEKAVDLDGGQYGGWDEHDHRHFVKLWNALDAVADIVRRGAAEIYGQTPDTVMQHCRWFDRYNEYVYRKKQLIAQWRTIKDAQQKRTIEETAESLSKTDHDTSDEAIRRQQEKDAALRRWREAKAAQEAEKARRDAAARAQAADAERQRVERRARILHDKVQRFRDAVKGAKENEAVKPAVKIDASVLENIRVRNGALLGKRQSLVASKRDELGRAAARSAALAAQARRAVRAEPDPARLLQATEATRARVAEPKQPRPAGGFILAAPHHRSVPSWRRGVN